MIHIEATEIIVPIISALCHPYDSESVLFFCAKTSEIIEIANPRMSDPRCAESANTAIEPASQPPYNCRPMKTNETQVAMTSFFKAARVCFFYKISCSW